MQQQQNFSPVASYKTKTEKVPHPKSSSSQENILSQLLKVEVAAADAATVHSAHPVASIRIRTKIL
jgi:hypothetical protein